MPDGKGCIKSRTALPISGVGGIVRALMLLGLVGCSSAPVITAVSPGSVRAGEIVSVAVADAEQGQIRLVGAVSVPITAQRVGDKFEFAVPPDAPTGVYAVEFTNAAGGSVSEPALEIWSIKTEPACSERVGRSVRILSDKLIIDYSVGSEVQGETEYPRGEITSVLLETAPCQQLYAMVGAERVLLTADTQDLGPRAEQLARVLNVPLQR